MQEVDEKYITLNDGTVVPYGLLVWSTGVGPSKFVKSLPFEKAPGGRLAVDKRLKVVGTSAGRSFNVC
jgi:NADH:ubiquinone reductase (non-electrogenic)